MRKIFYIAAGLVLAFASCSKDADINQGLGGPDTDLAGDVSLRVAPSTTPLPQETKSSVEVDGDWVVTPMEFSAQATKTSLGTDGTTTNWLQADKLNVLMSVAQSGAYNTYTNKPYSIPNGGINVDGSATFQGGHSWDQTPGAEHAFAAYYHGGLEFAATGTAVTLPSLASQTQSGQTTDHIGANNFMIAAAQKDVLRPSEGGSLDMNLYHGFAVLEFRLASFGLTGLKVKSIEVSSNLTGKALAYTGATMDFTLAPGDAGFLTSNIASATAVNPLKLTVTGDPVVPTTTDENLYINPNTPSDQINDVFFGRMLVMPTDLTSTEIGAKNLTITVTAQTSDNQTKVFTFDRSGAYFKSGKCYSSTLVLKDASARTYTSVTTTSVGTLLTEIEALGDPADIVSLKVTGPIDADDFGESGAFGSYEDGVPPDFYKVYYLPNLKHLDLSEAVISELPGQAFYDNTQLETIILPNSLETIGERAFQNCTALRGDLIIPNGVEDIGNHAFQGCENLDGDLVIPATVTRIGDYAFAYCSRLRGTLVIPSIVDYIGASAFMYCSGLTGGLTLPAGITSLESAAFSGCSGLNGPLVIPTGVTQLGTNAFTNCSGFDSLSLPEDLTRIGANAFSGCSGFKGTLTIPSTVVLLESQAFMDCSGFTGDLVVPNKIATIGESAFQDCSGFDGTLTLTPGAITTIDKKAFNGCSNLKGDINIPSTVTKIQDEAFMYCSGFKGSLNMPASLESLGQRAFNGCSGLTGTLTVPSVTGDNILRNQVFAGCSGFTGGITIPTGFTRIRYSAFENCSGLNGTIEIPATVSTIEYYAFTGCTNITDVQVYWTAEASIPAWNTNGASFDAGTQIVVPAGTTSLYSTKWASGSYTYSER